MLVSKMDGDDDEMCILGEKLAGERNGIKE